MILCWILEDLESEKVYNMRKCLRYKSFRVSVFFWKKFLSAEDCAEGAGDKIVFRALVDNEIHTIKQTITYEDDAIVGSISKPYVIQLDATTEVENTTISSSHIYAYDGILYVEGATEDYKVYDVLGRLMYQGRAPQLRLSNGVYLVQLGEETQQVVL